MNTIKSLLLMSARQRKLCKRLEDGRGRLFRMAYSWSHNADLAEDVVQETMIKAMNNVDKIKNFNALDGWLFRVMSNCFIDVCRKQRDEIDVDNLVLIEDETPESLHIQNEMLMSVRNAIACLPIKHRQVVTLIDIENFSYAEVSKILDVPQGTIMSRLNRARQTLKELLNEHKKENHTNNTKLKVVQ